MQPNEHHLHFLQLRFVIIWVVKQERQFQNIYINYSGNPNSVL